MIKWTATKLEAQQIAWIAERALPLYEQCGERFQTAFMDIEAAHCNGCPLDLAGLLKASAQDFNHDVMGIRKHINRDTGQIEGCFSPRYALGSVCC